MADADSSLSPEKRLLKLIEEPQSEKPGGPEKKRAPWHTSFSVPVLKARLDQAKEKTFSFLKQSKVPFGIQMLNGAVTAGTVILGIVLFVNTLYEMRALNSNALTDQLIVPASKMLDLMPVETKDLTAGLLENTQDSRNIFLPFGKRVKEAEPEKVSNSSKLAEMTKTLKLTGISYNPENPEKAFCMIEDLTKNITVFLRAGDQVSGLKVQKINPTTVTLDYQGETIEMR